MSSKNLAVITLGLLLPVAVFAAPVTPHQFYGTVNFDNGLAPDGVLIEAKIDSVVVGSTITSNGKYGYDPIFYVEDPDSNRDGEIIKFYANGIDSGEIGVFNSGDSTKIDLIVSGTVGTITETNEDAVIENETVAVTPTQPTNIKLGDNLNITVSSETNTSAVVNEVKKLTSAFFTGSAAVIAGNNLLNAFEINITGDDLTISVTISYDDAGIDENTIKPYRFNGTSWVEITPFSIDKSANTITFSVSSAETPYAVFGSEPEPEPAAPTGGGGGGAGGGGMETITSRVGDSNRDGKIDIFDFNLLMVNWGDNPDNLLTDLDNNGKIDIFDFNLLMVNWTG